MRLRLLQVILQPVFVTDDDESLVLLPVEPIPVSATDWPNVVELFATAVAQLRAQVDTADEPDPTTVLT